MNVSKELAWKVYIEGAQAYERNMDYEATQDFQINALVNSPDNLKWKVWLIGSRVEYSLGNPLRSRCLLEKCFN